MNPNISNIASNTISPAHGNLTFKKRGKTKDIIVEILEHDKNAYLDVVTFAPHLQGETNLATGKNIWDFLKNNITYKLDPKKKQFIQYPRRLYNNKVGDCKSFSIFTGAILKSLGIPYKYRFVNYEDGDLKHVYTVIPNNGNEIIIDAVYNKFNAEKKFNRKKDIMPETEIYSLGDLTDFSLKYATKAQILSDLAVQRIIAERNTAIKKGTQNAAQGLDAQLSYYREVENIVNSSNNDEERATMLLALVKGPKDAVFINRVIAGLNQLLVPNFDNLDEDQQEELKELIFEDLPATAEYFTYAFLPRELALRILTPEGMRKREKFIQALKEIAYSIQIDVPILMYMMKTFYIETKGISPESAVLYNLQEDITDETIQIGFLKGLGAIFKKVTKVAGGLIKGGVKALTGVDLGKKAEDIQQGGGTTQVIVQAPAPAVQKKSSLMVPLLIGGGVLVAGTIIYFVARPKPKSRRG